MKFIRIPKLDKWQHYKDGSRGVTWIKLHRDILHDYKFAQLPDTTKCHLMHLWLLASVSADKVLPYDTKWIAKQINATSPVDLNKLEALGFIEVVQNDSKGVDDSLALEEKRREEKRRRDVHLAMLSERFEYFWNAYPRKVNKKKAKDVWLKNEIGNGPFDDVMAGLEAAKRSDDWIKEEGKYIPHPTTWLNNERWTDEHDTSPEEKLELDWGD